MKIWTWTDEVAQKTLKQRLQQAKDSRKQKREARWRRAEAITYDVDGATVGLSNVSVSTEVDFKDEGQALPTSTNYVLKNVRFMHAQMSANPPAVAVRPASSDPEDRKASQAADRISRAGLRTYKFHERSDERNLNALIYGTGFLKLRWNPVLGELLEASEETGQLTPEGDFDVTVPSVWNIYLDADATHWDSVRFVFEEMVVPYEEAVATWPEHKEILDKYRQEETQVRDGHGSKKTLYDVVTLYEYWEKGLPINGFIGRYAVHTDEGHVLEFGENPERYRSISATYEEHRRKKEAKALPVAKAMLPYLCLTDIDEPNSPWGLSTVEFAASLQENLNRLDNTILNAVKAHGIPRAMIPESAEVDELSNDTWDIFKYKGNIPPQFMEPMPLPAAVTNLRQSYRMGIDDMQGINESMYGQQSREQSGYSMQYATNQGNMIRQRLFNKYVAVTEELHRRYLVIAANKWTTAKTIQVIGNENAFDTMSFKGADIMHGYDAVAELGSSLSLDPMTRRGELMNMMPLLEKANVDPATIMSLMRLGETDTVIDVVELARKRMQEYFDLIIETGIQKPPRKNEDHERMLTYAGQFVMMRAYQDLPDHLKDLIDEHIAERQSLIAAPPAPVPEMPQVPGMPEPSGGEAPAGLSELPEDILNF